MHPPLSPLVAPQRPNSNLTEFTSARDIERAFRAICLLALLLPLLLLLVLLVDAVVDASSRLSWQFLSSFPSRHPEQAGILAALAGTGALMVLTAALAIPIGVGAALYLEEYASENRLTSLIEINISNLAGVPSIIYGLLGLEVFVRALAMGRSLLAGAATLALLVLPMVIMASREALRTVPLSIREASYALGADRWQTLRRVVLPMCLPGILTGIILALARAIGETAPLITIGALTYVAFLPDSLMSGFTALPIQIFNWISRPQAGFHANAAAGIVVLLFMMLLLNGIAIWLRMRLQRRIYW
ncbi:MAG TPA: phosphate ABC transporter permease PstA [Thermoanaerobaculia bacterium]|nr:phosphate ABC transporter permease PstA [Thermoanaerobaculia bacterium]